MRVKFEPVIDEPPSCDETLVKNLSICNIIKCERYQFRFLVESRKIVLANVFSTTPIVPRKLVLFQAVTKSQLLLFYTLRYSKTKK